MKKFASLLVLSVVVLCTVCAQVDQTPENATTTTVPSKVPFSRPVFYFLVVFLIIAMVIGTIFFLRSLR